MHYQEKFWVLFSKKLSGEASPAELIELDELITGHPEWQYAIQNLEDLWKHQPLKKSSSLEEDAYLLHVHRMAEKNIPFGDWPDEFPAVQKKGRYSKWYWAAAAAVTLIVISFFVFRKSDTKKENQLAIKDINEISTQPGSKSKIHLPDGTTVLLNAGSRLTYTKDYGKEIREVNLVGEGFFDVQKNKDVPFIIHTSDINIKVLGTVFNVKAYPQDKKTETSLIRGSIEVTIKNRPNDKIILSPTEKLVVENKDRVQKIEKTKEGKTSNLPITQPLIAVNKINYLPVDSAVVEIQWTENKLVFRDETFADLAVDMERWYNVTIDIEDPALAEARLTGIFENETIEQALEALKLSTPFIANRKGNHISIHH